MRSTRLAVSAATIALLAAAAPAEAIHHGPPKGAVRIGVPKGQCAPQSGVYESGRIIRRKTTKSTQVTELFAGGSYRVTRCSAKGRFRQSQTVGRMTVANGGRQLVILSSSKRSGGAIVGEVPTYGAPENAQEAQALKQETLKRLLPKTTGKVVKVGPKVPDAPGLVAAQSGDECTDPAFAFYGARLSGNEPYAIAVTTLPPGFTTDAVRQQYFAMRIVNGHDSWNFTLNSCGFGSSSGRWHSEYTGPTTLRANAPSGQGADGLNTIDGDFGPICDSSTALACTYWTFVLNQPGQIFETDVRFNLSYTNWWDGNDLVGAPLPPAGTYDAFAVATHEAGHEMGCSHVPNSPHLTMYPFIAQGDGEPRTLGLGDINCMRALYDP